MGQLKQTQPVHAQVAERGRAPKRVLFTATLVRGHIAKFHVPYLRWFKEQGWETWVAARNDYPDGVCEIPFCDHYVDIPFPRSPFTPKTAAAYRALCDLVTTYHFDLVHTHTPVGSVLTRWACRKAQARGTSVVYTAHGFHFYQGAPALNWLLWYPVERFMTRFTSVLVTINQEDYARAQRVSHCPVEYCHGVGVDIARFRDAEPYDRGELGFGPDDVLVLAVGDLIPRKNHATIIEALSLLPEQVKLVICGEGVLRDTLQAQAQKQGVDSRVAFLGFRNDIPRIMKTCDMLAFPSVHEGLPVSVIEAMAAGLPVIASPIRGIVPDLLTPEETGLVLSNCNDAAGLARSIERVYEGSASRATMTKAAFRVAQQCETAQVVRQMATIYAKLPPFSQGH